MCFEDLVKLLVEMVHFEVFASSLAVFLLWPFDAMAHMAEKVTAIVLAALPPPSPAPPAPTPPVGWQPVNGHTEGGDRCCRSTSVSIGLGEGDRYRGLGMV